MGKTLRRYLVREIAGAFLAGIAIFSSILFLVRVVGLIEMILARGVPTLLVVQLLAAIFPSFLEATLPMAFLLSVVATLGRMASDHEALAMRAAGLSVWQISQPIVGFSLLVALATLGLSMTARPWGHRAVERIGFEIAKTRASAALKPRFFNTEFERMVLYVDHIDAGTGQLSGILLSDERGDGERQAIFARSGQVGGHERSGRLFLELLDGTSLTSRENVADYDVTRFRSLEVSLELRTATGNRSNSNEPATFNWFDSRERDTRQELEFLIEMHRRFSIAVAAIVLSLFGTALGFHPSPTTRSRALGISVVTILAFYGLLTSGVALARSESLPPSVAIWIPNALLATLALWCMSRNARDLPLLPRLLPRVPRGGSTPPANRHESPSANGAA